MTKSKIKIDKNIFQKTLKKYKPNFKLELTQKDKQELLCFARGFFEFILATGLSLMMPDSKTSYRIIKNRNEILQGLSQWKLKKSLRHLKNNKFINSTNRQKFRLTAKGQKQALFLLTHKLFIKIPKAWDGKWRMVIFDLPQSFAGNRDFLRQRLVNLGFIQVQKSVWSFPFDCEKEVNFLIESIKTKPYVYFLISEFKRDKKFIKYFKTIYPKQFKNY